MLHFKVAYFFMHRYDLQAKYCIYLGTSYIFVNELVYMSDVSTSLEYFPRAFSPCDFDDYPWSAVQDL